MTSLPFPESMEPPTFTELEDVHGSDPAEVAAVYLDKDAIREGPQRLYRYDGAERFYYTFDADGKVQLYPSVTTVIRATTPTPFFLMKWISDYGQRRAEQLKQERADYGTIMHALFAEFVIAREFNLDTLEARVLEWAQQHKLPWDTSGWAADLREDLVGFAQFMLDYDFHPIGIEIPLVSSDGFAGCVDLVGRCGKEKYLTVVDWKSSRTAFYDEQEIQTSAYRSMWNENFPDLPAKDLIVYGAKNWDERTRVRYRVNEVKEGPRTQGMFLALLRIWNMNNPPSKVKRPLIGGTLRIAKDNAELRVSFVTLEEGIAAQRAEKGVIS